jgi:prepilin-type N-terminal cleavage/methylation domain-containing protein
MHAADGPAVSVRSIHRRLGREDGFTLIEVLVAAVVLVVGLLALLGMLDVASHANDTNRVRQAATNLAREVVEDVRALEYSPQLATPTSIATGVASQLQPGATQSGSTLTVTRGGGSGLRPGTTYTFNVTFSTCSLDDPSDGYGNHSLPPGSGGSWCPDVAASGGSDSNPDDYKRISVTVTPTGGGSAARTYPVQQTVLIYSRAINGPAVTCLTPAGTACGSTIQPITTATGAVTFNVTTTQLAEKIQWLVNGNPPGTQDATGANGTYAPSGTTSSFAWTIPTSSPGTTIDGIYSITAIAFDANGNSGTRSTVQITVNEHPVIAPSSASFNAGFDGQIGGVDVQWVPSVDQDVLYYHVYHQYGNNVPSLVSCVTANGTVTTDVTGTSCTDVNSYMQSEAPGNGSCTYQQSYATSNYYWVVGVDRDPTTNNPRDPNNNVPGATAYQTRPVDANLCDHAPKAPTNLTGSLSNGALNLSWTAPASPVDPDSGDTITSWRIYRWTPHGASLQMTVANRFQLVGAGTPASPVTTATDASPDPGGTAQDYCVSAVDTHLDESPCSNVLQQ